jgi:hypothetical protein
MYVCMYVCMCVCIYAAIYISTQLYIKRPWPTRVYCVMRKKFISLCMYVCMYVCMCVSIYAAIYIYKHAAIYIYISTQLYIYIYKHAVQCVPLATETGISLIILPLMKILHDDIITHYSHIPLHFSQNERTSVQISLQCLHWY